MNDSIRSIAAIMRDLNSVLIFPHINADGDALGSASALCLALRKMGKKSYVMLSEPIAKNLDFMDCGCCTYDDSVIDDIELCMQVDCSGMNRIPNREEAWARGRLKGCIDHHMTGSVDIQYDFYRSEPKSAATGELIYLLIKELGVEIDLDIANCLFTAITTDTGNFQHTNTTKRTHDIAGELYEVEGFDSKAISALIYDRKSKEAMHMESIVLAELEFYAEGKLAAGKVTQALLDECGCTMDESEGLIQRIMSIDGIEIGVLFKENPDSIRCSLRAKNYANVSDVAVKFDGGGHVRAAGCTLDKPMEKAQETLVPELIKAL